MNDLTEPKSPPADRPESGATSPVALWVALLVGVALLAALCVGLALVGWRAGIAPAR